MSGNQIKNTKKYANNTKNTSKEMMLDDEMKVLEKLLYRNHGQHRKSMWFQQLQCVNKLLRDHYSCDLYSNLLSNANSLIHNHNDNDNKIFFSSSHFHNHFSINCKR